MIQTEKKKTTVTFGKGNNASIGVLTGNMKLTLQMLASELNVGDMLTPNDVKELPKIEMEFSNPKSIDVLIKALTLIKDNYYKNYGFSLAC